MTKIYTLEYECWEAWFEVTDEALAMKACKESLDFFGDPVTREDESADETIKAFLKFWGFELTIRTTGLVSLKDMQNLGERVEGLIPLDGSKGIKLAGYDRWSIEPESFNVTVKEAA